METLKNRIVKLLDTLNERVYGKEADMALALLSAVAGESIFPDKTPSVKLGLADSSELTAKEIEVLRFVCEGLEYSEIAERMHISQRTVKFHISNILSKTGYANKTRLAIAVTNKNFIIPSSPEKYM